MEEEEIKKKMLQERMQQQEEELKSTSSKILDPKARERLSNLKVVKPELARQLETYLFQLYQMGQIKGIINEEQLIMILKKLGEKKDFRIIRK